MINRIFMIVFSIGCLLAMLIFIRQTGFTSSGQVRHLNPIHYANLTVPDKSCPHHTGSTALPDTSGMPPLAGYKPFSATA